MGEADSLVRLTSYFFFANTRDTSPEVIEKWLKALNAYEEIVQPSERRRMPPDDYEPVSQANAKEEPRPSARRRR
jgi:hypothetical protein